MLKRTIVLLCGVLSAAILACGDNFPTDFQTAMKLRYSAPAAEAEAAFAKLAERKAGKRATDESLAQAAYCAAAQKKYDKAMEYAGKIEDAALNKLCRMNVLERQSKRAEILTLSRDEAIETWPDALIYDGLMCRGRAYAGEKDVSNAEKDLLAAVKNTVSADNKAFAYGFLGELYGSVSQDLQKALDAYGEILKLEPSFQFTARAVVSRARLLAAEGKGDQAFSEMGRLAKLNLDKVNDPYWHCWVPLCQGDVYVTLGKKTEALESYRKAETFTNAPADLLQEAHRKVGELEKKPQP
jgi:tetratricopeptide (TPR) repeat protein